MVVAVVVAEAEVLVQPAQCGCAASPGIPESTYFVSGLLALLFDGTPFALVLSLASFSSKAVCNLFRSSVVPEGGVVFAVTPPILSVTERRRLNRRLWPLKTTTRPSSRVLSRVQVVSASHPSLSSRRAFCSPRLDEDDDDGDDSAPKAAPTRSVPSSVSLSL